MAHDRAEIEAAILDIYKNKGIDLCVEVACSIAEKIDDKLQRMTFIEARRYSMNETLSRSHYRSREAYLEARAGYNSVMGKVYGSHSNLSRKRKATKKPETTSKRAAQKSESVTIEEDPKKKGQLRFVI